VKSASTQSRVERKKRVSARLRYSPLDAPVLSRKQKPPANPEVYWLERTPVDFYSFDEEYLLRLGARDPATEAHFVAYFSERLRITLRARGVDATTIEDVRQETFCRVWLAVQSGSVNNPSGFGSYVHSVCKNVLSETRRFDYRNQHDSLESTDVADEQLGLDEMIQRREHGALVRTILSELPERDRHILYARFFEERDNDEVCDDFGVDRDYLRVLLHRAINKFGELYKKRSN
jgi:RNA polymerase sigma-70 factor, ECF subfamily